MTTDLETKQDVYSLLLQIFACLNVINLIYFFHRLIGFKRTAAKVSELFWCAHDVLELYNGEYCDLLVGGNGNDEKDKEETIIATEQEINLNPIVEVKYEDKYLNDIKNLSLFTPEFIKQRDDKIADILDAIHVKVNNDMKVLEQRILLLDSFETQEREELILKIQELEYSLQNPNIAEVEEEALSYVKNTYLDDLLSNFVMEKTPLGNVIMYYNNNRGSFEYYSDNTIPYRYLETVSRKYVKSFNCVYLYVDMVNELNEYDRLQKEQEDKKEKEKLVENIVNTTADNTKKDVFAKFKTYNKESGTGRVNTAVPPKNSVPNNNNMRKKEEKVQLKQNANRFTCQGKICNFKFLKIPERKVIDKKYAISFADFKKMNSVK